MKIFILLIVTIVAVIGLFLLPKPATNPFPDYPYKAQIGGKTCYMDEIEYGSYWESIEAKTRGITSYQVIAGERCI